MNQEDIRRMGVDIDAVSLEADRLSRRLERIATQCGIKPLRETRRNEAAPALLDACMKTIEYLSRRADGESNELWAVVAAAASSATGENIE